MRLISFIYSGRQSQTVVTDLDLIEFYKYLYHHFGRDAAILFVENISDYDYQQWMANGFLYVTKIGLKMEALQR